MPCSVLLMVQTRESDERAVHERTVRYDYRYVQIERKSHRPPARSTVQVYEAADGQIDFAIGIA